MLVFLVFVLVSFALHPPASHAEWRDWVARPGVTIAYLLFFAALLGHLWVGLRDVLLDYAKPAGVRNTLLALVAFGLLGLGVWVLVIRFCRGSAIRPTKVVAPTAIRKPASRTGSPQTKLSL